MVVFSLSITNVYGLLIVAFEKDGVQNPAVALQKAPYELGAVAGSGICGISQDVQRLDNCQTRVVLQVRVPLAGQVYPLTPSLWNIPGRLTDYMGSKLQAR